MLKYFLIQISNAIYCTSNEYIEREVNGNNKILRTSTILKCPLSQNFFQVDQNLQLKPDEIDEISRSSENNVTNANETLSGAIEHATVHQPEIIQNPHDHFVFNSHDYLSNSSKLTKIINEPNDLEYLATIQSSTNNFVFNSHDYLDNALVSIPTIEELIGLEYPTKSEESNSNSPSYNSSGSHSTGSEENPPSQSNLNQTPNNSTYIDNNTTKLIFEEFQIIPNLKNNMLYEHIAELALRWLYFKPLILKFHENVINKHVWDTFCIEQNEISASAVILIDKLLEFNRILKFNTDIQEDRWKHDKLQKKIANLQTRINKIKKKIDQGIPKSKNFLSAENSLLRLKQLRSLAQEEVKMNRKNSLYFQIYDLINNIFRISTKIAYKSTNIMITIYEPFKNIVDFYNLNLKSNLHQYLVKLNFTFISANQRFIKYPNYENSPNYLAYLIVDLIHGICNSVLTHENFIRSKNVEFQQQVVDIIILYFLSLNKPEVTAKFLKNELLFNTFRSEVYSMFIKKEIREFLDKIIKEIFLQTDNRQIYQNSNIDFSNLSDENAIEMKELVKKLLSSLYEIGETSIKKALEIN